jgi:hypothetical protein
MKFSSKSKIDIIGMGNIATNRHWVIQVAANGQGQGLKIDPTTASLPKNVYL